jgi:septal ring factor EnvC (AmiA/AmiB activator)
VLSNRESARRSRRRTQNQLTSLEAELEGLRTDKVRLKSELDQATGMAAQLAADKAALLAEVQHLRGQLARTSTSACPAAPPLMAALPPAGAAAAESTASGLPLPIQQAQQMASGGPSHYSA